MSTEDVQATLRAAIVLVEGSALPRVDVENAWSLVDAGEPGIALENQCTRGGIVMAGHRSPPTA